MYLNRARRVAELLASGGDRMTRDWALLTAGSLARLGLGFIASVVVARSLGPTLFGVYAVLGVVSGAAGVLVDPGLTTAAVTSIAAAWSIGSSAAARLTRSFVLIRLLLAIAVSAVIVSVVAIGPTSWLGPSINLTLLALTMAGVVATAASGALAAILQAIGRFGRLSIVLIANSLLTVIFAAVLSYAGALNLTSAIGVLGVATSIGSIVLAWRFLPTALRPGPIRRAIVLIDLRSLLKVGRWLWIADVLAILAGRADVVILARWLDPATLGAYAVALNLASKADVVNHTLFTVLLPTAATLREPGSVRRFVVQGLRRSGVIAALLLLLIPLSTTIVVALYGQRYESAAILFRGLVLVAMVDLLAAPVLILPFQANRPRLIAVADALRLVAFVASAILLVPKLGANGAVLARLAGRVAGVGFVVLALRFGHQSSIDHVEVRR